MHDAVEDLQKQNAVQSWTVGRLHFALMRIIKGAVAGNVVLLICIDVQRVEIVIEATVDGRRVEGVVEEKKNVSSYHPPKRGTFGKQTDGTTTGG